MCKEQLLIELPVSVKGTTQMAGKESDKTSVKISVVPGNIRSSMLQNSIFQMLKTPPDTGIFSHTHTTWLIAGRIAAGGALHPDIGVQVHLQAW